MKYLQTFRLHPTPAQAAKMRKRFALAGYAYNWALQETERVWDSEQRHLSMFDVKELYQHHVNYELRRACHHEENEALVHLGMAYDKYFARQTNKPRMKQPEDMTSFTILACSAVPDYEHNTVRLPYIGHVRCRFYRRLQDSPTTATVKEMRPGEFRLVYMADINEQPADDGTPEVVGIDLGLKTFATLSDGTKIDFPVNIYGTRANRHEQHLQRMQARRKKDSRRWQRAKDRLSRFYEHRNNQRRDFHCQTAASITKQYQAIAVEDLHVEHMMTQERSGRRQRNRQFSGYGLRLFLSRLHYRCLRTGTQLLKVGRYEPTSKRCHHCGYVRPSLSLDVREWTCPECGTRHDRDINAAINIKMLGQQLQQTHPDDSGGVLDAERTKRSRREASKAGVDKRLANRLTRSSQEDTEYVTSRLARKAGSTNAMTASQFLKMLCPIIVSERVSTITDVSKQQLCGVRRSLMLHWRRQMMAEKCEALRTELLDVLCRCLPSVEHLSPDEYARRFNADLKGWLKFQQICRDNPMLTYPVTPASSILWHIYLGKLIRKIDNIIIKV